MSGTDNSAAPPSYLDKAKDAVQSVVCNLTGHDEKETVSKTYIPKVSSAAMDTFCEAAIKSVKDTDGAIQPAIKEAVIMHGARMFKAAETGDATKKVSSDADKVVEAGDTMKMVSSGVGESAGASDAMGEVTSDAGKATSEVVDDVKKAETLKDAHKPLNDAKLMDGASDTKPEKKMDVEEKPVEKADCKASHKKMDDKIDNKMDHKKMDHKMMGDEKMDHKMMGDEKMEKIAAEKKATAAHKMGDACESAACMKKEESKSHSSTVTEKVSHVAGEMYSKKGSTGANDS